MGANASAGLVVSLSAGTPGTYNSSGFGALSWTTWGEIEDFSDFGEEWATTPHKPVAIKGTVKVKTSRDPGGLTVTGALNEANAGQILARAALGSTSLYSFRVVSASGNTYYARGYVTSFRPGGFNQDGKEMFTAAIEISTDADNDADWIGPF